MSCLNWQAGDCFDMSLVLCSLLLGVGFNAFVVVGYAPLAVTTNDQLNTTCPVLEREAASNALKSAGLTKQTSKPTAQQVCQVFFTQPMHPCTLARQVCVPSCLPSCLPACTYACVVC